MNREGVCKLTLEKGKFIRSHLIPQALTKPEVTGGIMKQIGEGSRPKKATSSSWYDYELVIRKGEDVLTEYDTSAINILRDHQLIWSSWKESFISDTRFHIIDENYGVRELSGLNWKSLRLFGLSLLWRACNSSQAGFCDIKIPKGDLEKIRILLINRDCGAIHFYPIKFCQLATKGKIHNQTPFVRKFELPKRCEVTKSRYLNIVRFYFDGLIMHIHLSKTLKQIKGFDQQILGFNSNRLIIPTVSYEVSFQRENMESIVSHYE